MPRTLRLASMLLWLAAVAAGAQPVRGEPARHHGPQVFEVGDPARGRQVFESKGCVKCHAIRGEGGDVGPDLGQLRHTHNLFQMVGIMWNHANQMTEAMAARGIRRPEFKGREMAHLVAYLHSLEVIGDPARGRVLFERKGCARCHAVFGEGGKIGPELAETPHPHPPLELAGQMWNHAPVMEAMMRALQIPAPTFEGTEMADLLAYLDAVQRQARRERAPVPHGHRH